MKNEFYQHIFGKYTNVKFRNNPSSGSRVVPCGQTAGPDRRTDRYTRRSQQSLFAIWRTHFLYHISQALVPPNPGTLIPLISIIMKPAPIVLRLAHI